MTSEQRFYILAQNGLGAAFVNAVLNAAIGWGLTRGVAELPTWKVPGVAADLVVTAFGITFGTCIVLPRQIRRDFERGRATLPALPPSVRAVVACFPKGFFLRALSLGVLSVPLFAPPALIGLLALGAPSLARVPFVEAKALFSAIQGGLVTPFIVVGVLSDLANRGARKSLSPLSAEAP